MDIVLRGECAVIEAIERDFEDKVHVAVVVDADPGREFGLERMPGHRFFFSPEELEPLGKERRFMTGILVAGIGNIFKGDDAFGVEVAQRLARKSLPDGVKVVDFGIRGHRPDLRAARRLRRGDPGRCGAARRAARHRVDHRARTTIAPSPPWRTACLSSRTISTRQRSCRSLRRSAAAAAGS